MNSYEVAPFTIAHLTVGDYYGTDYAAEFIDLDDSTPVIVAHDPPTGLCCALALADGQTLADLERWARVKLAGYIARQRMVA